MNDRKILTDRAIRAAKPAKAGERNQITDGIVPGLALRVTDNGAKSFVLVARYPGSNNPTRRALGTYGAITLDDARTKARDWLALLQQGIDPAEQEARERAAEQRKRLNTFAAMAEDFIASKLPSEKRGKEIELTIRRELLPKWGGLAVTDITESHVRDLVKAKARDYEAMARNLLALIRRLFNWAIDQRAYGLEHSPCARLKPNKLVGEQEARTRILCNDEMRALWRAAETVGGPYGKFYQALLLTGQRRNEVAEARWAEIDLKEKLWTIPAERMKAGAAHEVPLSGDMVTLLKSLPRGKGGDFVFSASDGVRPIARFSAEKEKLDKAMASSLVESSMHSWFTTSAAPCAPSYRRSRILPTWSASLSSATPSPSFTRCTISTPIKLRSGPRSMRGRKDCAVSWRAMPATWCRCAPDKNIFCKNTF
jgi:integrase